VIEFYIDTHSGVPPYLQIGQQVRRALKLGLLEQGDQLPTVKEVVARLAINPNTVSKAYRELEHEGLVAARVGVGTFVATSAVGESLSALAPLRHELEKWMESARRAGLDDESIEALVRECFRSTSGTVVA
jgi:GntR family transcriptional regulator